MNVSFEEGICWIITRFYNFLVYVSSLMFLTFFTFKLSFPNLNIAIMSKDYGHNQNHKTE